MIATERQRLILAAMAGESFILLIEESDYDAEVDMMNLRAQGITTPVTLLTSAGEGEAFLDNAWKAGETLPLAIILALGLEPRLGYEFIRWVRRQPQFHTMVVIAIGTLGRMTEVQESYAAGANAYFTKASDFSALARTLRTVLNRSEEETSMFSRDTHPAFKSSPHLYEARRVAESGGMANPAPVLLVDDDEGHARQFAQGLDLLKLKNRLQRCASVEEAINYLAGRAPFEDRAKHPAPIVLFLDIRLPDSHRLLAWLEAHPESRPAATIALTSSHDMRPVIQAYHLGVHSFLKEPPKLEELRNALTSIPKARFCGDATSGYWIEESK